jgi:hypothetical protein
MITRFDARNWFRIVGGEAALLRIDAGATDDASDATALSAVADRIGIDIPPMA